MGSEMCIRDRFEQEFVRIEAGIQNILQQVCVGPEKDWFRAVSDPCVLRFMMGDEVMGMVAIHVDDIL